MAVTQIKDGYNGGSDNQLRVNDDGSINIGSGGGGGSNASVGPVNVTSPTSATEIAGVGPTGLLTPVSVTSTGAINVVTSGSSQVSGTVTSDQAGLNSFQTEQYSIGVTAVQLTPTPLANRSSISLRVTAASGQAIFIGNNGGVTVNNGYPLYNGDTLQMDLTPANTIYAVASAASQTLYVLEIA